MVPARPRPHLLMGTSMHREFSIQTESKGINTARFPEPRCAPPRNAVPQFAFSIARLPRGTGDPADHFPPPPLHTEASPRTCPRTCETAPRVTPAAAISEETTDAAVRSTTAPHFFRAQSAAWSTQARHSLSSNFHFPPPRARELLRSVPAITVSVKRAIVLVVSQVKTTTRPAKPYAMARFGRGGRVGKP